MRCYLVEGTGFENLKQAERPLSENLQEREVLVDVKACSLNFRDILVVKGLYGSGVYPPFIPLSDMAGVVRACGSKVSELKPGDRVINAPFRHWPAGTLRPSWARTFVGAVGLDGVLAEQIVYPADSLMPIPEQMDFAEASTLPVAGLTAWAAVVVHGKTRPGDWVLLQGTGGVSIFAAQICHAIGAKTILTTSTEEKARLVKKQFGVTETVIYREPNWPKRVKEITQGRGVDVVVDVAGGDTLAQSLKLCSYSARVAVIGVLSQNESKVSIIDLIHHQISLKGIYTESAEELAAFVKGAEAIRLKPAVDRIFPFEEAKEALKFLESQKHIGKVVIKI